MAQQLDALSALLGEQMEFSDHRCLDHTHVYAVELTVSDWFSDREDRADLLRSVLDKLQRVLACAVVEGVRSRFSKKGPDRPRRVMPWAS